MILLMSTCNCLSFLSVRAYIQWFIVFCRKCTYLNKITYIATKHTLLAQGQDVSSLPKSEVYKTRFFPDISLTFGQFPNIFSRAVKFPDISGFSKFSRQVITTSVLVNHNNSYTSCHLIHHSLCVSSVTMATVAEVYNAVISVR